MFPITDSLLLNFWKNETMEKKRYRLRKSQKMKTGSNMRWNNWE